MSVYEELTFAPLFMEDLFIQHRGKSAANRRHGSTPHIVAAARNNSQVGFIAERALFPGGWLALVNTGAGGVGYCTYQPVPFWASNNVTALEPRNMEATESALLALTACVRFQTFGKFNYGNIANVQRVKKTRIMLPVIFGSGDVDWDGLDRLGRECIDVSTTRMHDCFQTKEGEDGTLPELKFEPMFIIDVVSSMKASSAWYDKSKLTLHGPAAYPFVSRTEINNGVDGFCPRQEKEPEAGNAITIGLDTQTIAYQPVAFYTSQNIQVIRDSGLNEYNGMLLATLIKQQMAKFSWGGNGATLGRLKKTRIMIPVTMNPKGQTVVDWDGMTQYGRAIRVRTERNIKLPLDGLSIEAKEILS